MSKTGAKPAAKARAKATATEPAADGAPDLNLEAVAGRIRELNERIIASSMQAGETTVNSYAKMLENIAQLTENVGKASPVEWLTTFATAQANLTRDLAESYTAVARKLAN